MYTKQPATGKNKPRKWYVYSVFSSLPISQTKFPPYHTCFDKQINEALVNHDYLIIHWIQQFHCISYY